MEGRAGRERWLLRVTYGAVGSYLGRLGGGNGGLAITNMGLGFEREMRAFPYSNPGPPLFHFSFYKFGNQLYS